MHGSETAPDIIMTFNGEKIGEVKSIDCTINKEAEEVRKPFSFSGTGTIIGGFTVDHLYPYQQDILGHLQDQHRFDIEGSGNQYLPPKGVKVPKKKRLKKKFMKKHTHRKSFAYKNCEIILD